MRPVVSIIIPVFNREHLILETLKSVQKQDFEKWVCFVIDDGSTDNTEEKVIHFIKNDARFIFIKRPEDRKKGASTCRNIGLEQVNTKYVQFLDSDDLISKNKLAQQVSLLDKENDYTIATCKWGTFNKKFQLFEGFRSYAEFNNVVEFLNALTFSKGFFPPHSYLINKKIIEISGYWNENITLNDDGEFMLRMLCHVNRIVFADEAVAWYRTSTGSNLSALDNIEKVERAILSWKLIACNLHIRFGKEGDYFLNWSKNIFFINVKNNFPGLIDKYAKFFSIQLKEEKRKKRYNVRVIRKLNKLIR
jgi:glycosyltransferase involved in cell wall biosynthesis